MNFGKCIICKLQNAESSWKYVWKGEYGNACLGCGREFHLIGGYLNGKAAQYLERLGLTVSTEKEKFGSWRIYHGTPEFGTDAYKRAMFLLEFYKDVFNEFSWDWDIAYESKVKPGKDKA